MPNFDQTGPNSQGQMTGRGLGDCPKKEGFFRRGLRRCCPIFNRGRNSQAFAKEDLNQEIADTKEYLKDLEEEKQNIENK